MELRQVGLGSYSRSFLHGLSCLRNLAFLMIEYGERRPSHLAGVKRDGRKKFLLRLREITKTDEKIAPQPVEIRTAGKDMQGLVACCKCFVRTPQYGENAGSVCPRMKAEPNTFHSGLRGQRSCSA